MSHLAERPQRVPGRLAGQPDAFMQFLVADPGFVCGVMNFRQRRRLLFGGHLGDVAGRDCFLAHLGQAFLRIAEGGQFRLGQDADRIG